MAHEEFVGDKWEVGIKVSLKRVLKTVTKCNFIQSSVRSHGRILDRMMSISLSREVQGTVSREVREVERYCIMRWK